jgi:hypothetical protein
VSVTVVVPWRGGCEWREAAWRYLSGWWAQNHPTWQVITTTDAGDGPWCKAAAVAAALPRADGDVIVVADADVLCADIGLAAAVVTAGDAPWAAPHHAVYRLTPQATVRVCNGEPLPDVTGPRTLLRGVLAESHRGVLGGGLVVLPRALWDVCPLDARFTGWGQEDLAWGWALARVAGAGWRGHSPLLHLWHPPQPRANRAAGSAASMELWGRYRRAYTAQDVLDILQEPGARCGHPAPEEVADGGR